MEFNNINYLQGFKQSYIKHWLLSNHKVCYYDYKVILLFDCNTEY